MSVDSVGSGSERRRAARVACRLPIRLVRGSHVTHGVTEDLSRAGVRVRLPLDGLELGPEVELAGVARRLDQRLGEACVGEFHWQSLGSLVRKVLRVVRVTRVPDDPFHVDLGCELRVPLDALESEALGVDLPPMLAGRGFQPWATVNGEGPAPAPRATMTEEPVAAAPGARRRAVLMPPRARGRAPLRAQAPQVSESSVVLSLPEPARFVFHVQRQDATALLLAFDERYGSEHGLLLLEGDEPVWSGMARVNGLEFQRVQQRLVLTLDLPEPLRPDELERLGVAR
jgi:hypothetical protein